MGLSNLNAVKFDNFAAGIHALPIDIVSHFEWQEFMNGSVGPIR